MHFELLLISRNFSNESFFLLSSSLFVVPNVVLVNLTNLCCFSEFLLKYFSDIYSVNAFVMWDKYSWINIPETFIAWIFLWCSTTSSHNLRLSSAIKSLIHLNSDFCLLAILINFQGKKVSRTKWIQNSPICAVYRPAAFCSELALTVHAWIRKAATSDSSPCFSHLKFEILNLKVRI